MNTGWRAQLIASVLSRALSDEPIKDMVGVEEAREVNRRKSTFFAQFQDGRQYRVTVSEWRERKQ